VAANDKWITISDGIRDAVITTIAGIDADYASTFRLLSIWHEAYDSAASGNLVLTNQGKIQLTGALISGVMTSNLCIQNRTRAELEDANPNETGTQAHGHHASTTHIENNPLKGRAYEVNGMNGFRLRGLTDNDLVNTFLLTSDSTTGNIVAHSDNTTLSTAQRAQLSRPPLKQNLLRCKRTAPITLDPGAIKKSYLKSGFKMTVNSFLQKLRPYMQVTGGTAPLIWIGRSRLLALEKMLHVESTDPDISIGFERHDFFQAQLHLRHQPLAAEVTTSAIVNHAAPS
jgi:hypothetical protein